MMNAVSHPHAIAFPSGLHQEETKRVICQVSSGLLGFFQLGVVSLMLAECHT